MSQATPAAEPARENTKAPKAFCEFFAGIGLVRLGLEKSGWSCVYANDNDPKKQQLYRSRFGADEHFHLEDVKRREPILEKLGAAPFLATASFPCIDLSLAGHGRGFQGEHSSVFFGFADVLHALGAGRPQLVMLENVSGFLSSHQGRDFRVVANTLADLGYWLDAFLLDAKYFVPQSRTRVFLIGVQSQAVAPLLTKATDEFFLNRWQARVGKYPQLRPPRLIRLMERIDLPTGWAATPIRPPPVERQDLRSVVDLDPSQDWWDDAEVSRHYEMMSDAHRRLVDQMLSEGGLRVGTIFRRKRQGQTRAEVRFDGVAGCLRTPRGGSAKQIVIVIDSGKLRIRWMSPREYARLQGADDFPLVGTRNQQLFGFGDAVCVPVIEWIDRCVLTPIYDAASRT